MYAEDFNLWTGIIFGKQALQHMTKENHIHYNQYGKPGRECQNTAIIRTLYYQIAKLKVYLVMLLHILTESLWNLLLPAL